MAEKGNISRRQFVASAISVAAVSSIPAHRAFAGVLRDAKLCRRAGAALTDSPGWKDQGVENLAKSPHAKLQGYSCARRDHHRRLLGPTPRDQRDQEHSHHARSARSQRPHE